MRPALVGYSARRLTSLMYVVHAILRLGCDIRFTVGADRKDGNFVGVEELKCKQRCLQSSRPDGFEGCV